MLFVNHITNRGGLRIAEALRIPVDGVRSREKILCIRSGKDNLIY